LPTLGRERGGQTAVLLLACKGASCGRAAAVNVKTFDGHAGTLGTYRRKRLPTPCMHKHTLVPDLGVTESTYCAEPTVTGPRLRVSSMTCTECKRACAGENRCEWDPKTECATAARERAWLFRGGWSGTASRGMRRRLFSRVAGRYVAGGVTVPSIGQSVEKRVASLRGGGPSLLIRPAATSFFCDRTAIEGTPHGARDRRGLH